MQIVDSCLMYLLITMAKFPAKKATDWFAKSSLASYFCEFSFRSRLNNMRLHKSTENSRHVWRNQGYHHRHSDPTCCWWKKRCRFEWLNCYWWSLLFLWCWWCTQSSHQLFSYTQTHGVAVAHNSDQLLLMEEILHPFGMYKNLVNNGDFNYQPQLVIAGFLN